MRCYHRRCVMMSLSSMSYVMTSLKSCYDKSLMSPPLRSGVSTMTSCGTNSMSCLSSTSYGSCLTKSPVLI